MHIADLNEDGEINSIDCAILTKIYFRYNYIITT